ncbi:MAG TPA: toll/interleukin-1 receptor domain-containing protein [Pyrinomonadaceae bacterium]|nr:toll/interleukin-1 receptor domain-containing protein [Pyrinomonadaceae bacterium]
MRSQVFISYSHKDRSWLEQLQEHLKPLEREGRITRWDDTRIASGQKWEKVIEGGLASTKVAVLLVSPAFMASDFIANNELPPLLEAAERDGAVILPVIIIPSRYMQTRHLSQFQAVNDPSKPLVDMSEGERARLWVKLTEDILSALAPESPEPHAGGGGASNDSAPPAPKVTPDRRAGTQEGGLEVNVLDGAQIRNTRAGNITGVTSEAGAGPGLKPKVGVLNESTLENSELGDVIGVVLKGGGEKSE